MQGFRDKIVKTDSVPDLTVYPLWGKDKQTKNYKK